MVRRRPNSPLRLARRLGPSLTVLVAMLPVGLLDLQAAEPATKSYEAKGVRIEVPANWEVVVEKTTVFTAREPVQGPNDTFHENVRLNMVEIPAGLTLERILEMQEDDARSSFEILGSGRLPGGKHEIGWLAIAPKTIEAGERRDVKVDYYFIEGRRSYALHCISAQAEYETYRPQFEKIARSIALPGTAPSVPQNDRSRPREGSKTIGDWTFKAMLAAIIVFGGAAVIRRFTKRRRTYPEI